MSQRVLLHQLTGCNRDGNERDEMNTKKLYSQACFRECAEWANSCLGGSRERTATSLGANCMRMPPTSGSVKVKNLTRSKSVVDEHEIWINKQHTNPDNAHWREAMCWATTKF